MTTASDCCVVLSTAGNREEAEGLARSLVSNGLAACVQIIEITSYYVWDGEVNKEPEFLLLVKTTHDAYHKVEEFISQNHSYEVPEVVQSPINEGLERYLNWIGSGEHEVK